MLFPWGRRGKKKKERGAQRDSDAVNHKRVVCNDRPSRAGKKGGGEGEIHTDLSSVRKSRKADEFSLQPLIKEFAMGKTQHVILMEDRDHGPNG